MQENKKTLLRIFRYPCAKITDASFHAGEWNTITFYFDSSSMHAYPSLGKKETRWCYYLPALTDDIKSAIEEGIEVTLLVKRYSFVDPKSKEINILDFCEGILFN